LDILSISLILTFLLFLFLGAGVWVALALIGVAVIAMMAFTSAPVGAVLATTTWGSTTTFSLIALPLFVWMGEILFRTRLSEDMFKGIAPWVTRLPGRLLHVNVVACGVFAAISGSSAATAVTIGRMSMPELRKRGYDDRMSIGTLAGSGTLGLLIPPSIILIVYGIAAELSIARLFIAGILPGIMLMALFMGFIIVWALLNPSKIPKNDIRLNFWEKIYESRRLLPILALIIAVLGSIYAGIATPVEAAAVGVAGALLLAWGSGGLTRAIFVESLMGATRTSCMISFIFVGAAFLTIAMGFTGIPRALTLWIGDMGLGRYGLIAALTIFFIILGCFLDGISVVLLTTSLIMPMIQSAGIDLMWFGIYLVLVVEMSQITPPVGFNLFVLQGLTGKNILEIARSAFPFFILLQVAVILLVIFPDIATYLPEKMMNN
jgi:C4-dicarboxylate transporter DctM subunit